MHTKGSVPKDVFPERYSVCELETKAKRFKRFVTICEHSSMTSCEYTYASLNDGDTV